MSLTVGEQRQTSAELHANHLLSGLSRHDVQADLGFTAGQLEATLDVASGCDPADVWLLRDHLQQVITAAGRTPVPYSVLAEAARAAAAGWFPLRPAPIAHHQR